MASDKCFSSSQRIHLGASILRFPGSNSFPVVRAILRKPSPAPRLSRESFRATAFCRKLFTRKRKILFRSRTAQLARSLAICSRSRRRVAACTHATPPLRPHHPLRSHGISVCMRLGLALLHLPPPSPPPSETLLCGRHRFHCLALQASTPAPTDSHSLALTAHASCCRC